MVNRSRVDARKTEFIEKQKKKSFVKEATAGEERRQGERYGKSKFLKARLVPGKTSNTCHWIH